MSAGCRIPPLVAVLLLLVLLTQTIAASSFLLNHPAKITSPLRLNVASSAQNVLPLVSKSLPTVGAFGALVGYHVKLFRDERNGKANWRTCQSQIRNDWSVHVRESEGWLYAVQTLRNAITANTFLATTVLTMLTVVATKIVDSTMIKESMYKRVQFATIAVCMLRSAYEFSQSARLMTHAGFMFPVMERKGTGSKVDGILRKSAVAQWLGLRWFYLSLSGIAWTFGELSFLATALVLVRFFQSIDQVPADAA